jgi:hypothetical protein
MPKPEATAASEVAALDGPLIAEQLLTRAAELVGRGWCQSTLAEDRDGRPVPPWSETASRWSPLGALLAVWHESPGDPEAFETAYTALALATGGRLEAWNEAPWRTRRHVLSAFARARQNIPEARARQASTNDAPPHQQS